MSLYAMYQAAWGQDFCDWENFKKASGQTNNSLASDASINMFTGNHSLQPVFVLSRRPATSYILANLVFKQTLQQCGVVVRCTR